MKFAAILLIIVVHVGCCTGLLVRCRSSDGKMMRLVVDETGTWSTLTESVVRYFPDAISLSTRDFSQPIQLSKQNFTSLLQLNLNSGEIIEIETAYSVKNSITTQILTKPNEPKIQTTGGMKMERNIYKLNTSWSNTDDSSVRYDSNLRLSETDSQAAVYLLVGLRMEGTVPANKNIGILESIVINRSTSLNKMYRDGLFTDPIADFLQIATSRVAQGLGMCIVGTAVRHQMVNDGFGKRLLQRRKHGNVPIEKLTQGWTPAHVHLSLAVLHRLNSSKTISNNGRSEFVVLSVNSTSLKGRHRTQVEAFSLHHQALDMQNRNLLLPVSKRSSSKSKNRMTTRTNELSIPLNGSILLSNGQEVQEIDSILLAHPLPLVKSSKDNLDVSAGRPSLFKDFPAALDTIHNATLSALASSYLTKVVKKTLQLAGLIQSRRVAWDHPALVDAVHRLHDFNLLIALQSYMDEATFFLFCRELLRFLAFSSSERHSLVELFSSPVVRALEGALLSLQAGQNTDIITDAEL